ncbi:MAG TPA: DMT family transporter [Candidatus Aquilonibacter sp.]|nr:DMT family transporter [Candidatus Aquilonibacter sp.]
MQVGLSLLAALFYGAADFCGGFATKRTAVLTVTVVSQFAGLIVLLAALPFFPASNYPSDYLYGALGGVCGAAGIALLYHALSIGKMGVVSPVTAVLAAALPVAVTAISGARLAPLQLAGIGCALLAIVLISASFENGIREIRTPGLKEAAASGLLLGAFYLLLARAHPAAGLHNLLAARLASVAVLGLFALARGVDLRPGRSALPLIVLAGALDMSTNVLYVLATFHGALAIAAVLTSLYPASTVFLAAVLLRERLSRVQWLGVIFAFAGVVLIALRR